jgi:methylmalonyl-CoA/ethylmalonyl-CoA epimerase
MLPYLRFHHIGIAVRNMEYTVCQYIIGGGYLKTPTVFDPVQNVNICFLEKSGMPRVELLEPVDEGSPVTKYLHNNGVTPYHICYEADDLEQAVSDLRKRRFLVVVKPVEAVAIDNRRICFLYHKDVGLIELVEAKKS